MFRSTPSDEECCDYALFRSTPLTRGDFAGAERDVSDNV